MCAALLTTLYSDPRRLRLLQLVVDTYAVQHPGVQGRRRAQSVALHLMTLCLFLERGADPNEGTRLHRKFVRRPAAFPWLEPPASRGILNVCDVTAARTFEDYESAVWKWAGELWDAWSPHHATVRAWLDDALDPG